MKSQKTMRTHDAAPIMNNPFSRLKHYLPGKDDPQENHATECLASCLVFSPRIRGEFVRFLLNGKSLPFEPAGVDVTTQYRIESGGYIDLILRQDLKLVIAIEVKVKSLENCPHHIKQLCDYNKWLNSQSETGKRLFTLVRNGDPDFNPTEYGASGRRTWPALHKYFKNWLRESNVSEVEFSLIENFCDYLESEAIVSTYAMKDLISYAAGLKARKAVTGIFNQVSECFKEDGFETIVVEEKKDKWPQLRIQHPRWKKIFGDGENWKICLWFCVPGIWGQTEPHAFSVEIELWNLNHENDWQFTRSKLPIWLDQLRSQKFNWTVYNSWNRGEENVLAEKIRNLDSPPKRINAFARDCTISLDQNQLQKGEDNLIHELVDRIRSYSKIVDSLGSSGSAKGYAD